MANTAIEVNNLTKIYDGKKAVNNISFKINKGEIFGFLGPNGAGKTTTIKTMLGLIHPSNGNIKINNLDIQKNPKEIKKKVGYVPEKIGFYDNLTGLQNLNFYAEMKNVPLGQCHQLLLKYGLGDSANKKVGNYSSGMKQKLAIARASLGDPEIMILDEPTAGLDPRAVILVRDTIKELNKKGVTFFISSHILSEIQAICNRVGIINHGVLVAKNSVNELTKQLQIKPKLFLQLTKITDKIIKEIKSLKGVEKVDKQGEELIVICSPEARAKVILLIEKHGETVLNMRTEEISLEEVFMKFTEG